MLYSFVSCGRDIPMFITSRANMTVELTWKHDKIKSGDEIIKQKEKKSVLWKRKKTLRIM